MSTREQIRQWMEWRLAVTRLDDRAASTPAHRLIKMVVIGAAIFTVAFGVRLLEWQDRVLDIQGTGPLQLMDRMAQHYHREARRMMDQGRILFSYPDDPGDAHPVLHPPGYSIVLAALYGDKVQSGPGSYRLLRLLQVTCDAAAAVFIFLTGAELLPVGVAVIAGALVAFSPQLAFYSLWLTPESLSSFVIVVATYVLVRAILKTTTRARVAAVLILGILIGVSCWLRSINLLFAALLCLVASVLLERGKRLGFSVLLLATAAAVILPITLRNWNAYHYFIPLSIGSGITLIEGISEYDTEGRFGLPRIDDEAKARDVEWYGRPDYGRSPWAPDGVERDRARLARGLAVVRSNPVWFSGVMLRRARSMLRYNDSVEESWPSDSAKAPVIEREPPASHSIDSAEGERPTWRSTPQDLVSGGRAISTAAKVTAASGGGEVEIVGDDSAFGDQFVSGPISVQRYTDYAVRLHCKFEQGAAIKVTSSDRRIMLGSVFRSTSSPSVTGGRAKIGPELVADSNSHGLEPVEMSLASGDRTEVRLVISNNGAPYARPAVLLGAVELLELGPTAHLWSRYVRPVTRSIQRGLYTTSRMLILFVVGISLLAAAGQARTLLLLIAAPAYYLCAQSAFHTEYRYTLPIHYFLFVLAAVALYCTVAATWLGAVWLKRACLNQTKKK